MNDTNEGWVDQKLDEEIPQEAFPYESRVEAAKLWLGRDYLLAKPERRRK